MKKIALAAVIAAASISAHAETFFQIEVGAGAQISKDMGDGTWKQDGVWDNHEKMYGRSYLAGFTGEAYVAPKWDVRWHADYLYFGGLSASCECVPDSEYNPVIHKASAPGSVPFSGQGHTQGVMLLADVGYDIGPFRLGVLAGPWVYWATWHEAVLPSAAYPAGLQMSHRTTPQIGWTAGASLDYGNTSIRAQYLSGKSQWNPNPAMVQGTYMVTVTHRF